MKNRDKISLLEDGFSDYLRELFSNEIENKFLENLLRYSNPYIFGGVIKDYILGNKGEHRDVDIVVDIISHELEKKIGKYIVRKNQFGGLKLTVSNINIDLWEIRKTWALNKEKLLHDFYKEYLPSTSFFNITAAIFSIKDNKFIIDDGFRKFLKSKKLSIVYEDNPYPELCIVKTYEFSKKYNLKISVALKEYLKKYYTLKKDKLEIIQIKHYGIVKFSESEISSFISNQIESLNSSRKGFNQPQENNLFSQPLHHFFHTSEIQDKL